MFHSRSPKFGLRSKLVAIPSIPERPIPWLRSIVDYLLPAAAAHHPRSCYAFAGWDSLASHSLGLIALGFA